MSITDELREYADRYSLTKRSTLHAIADRIDAEHERQLDEKYQEGRNWSPYTDAEGYAGDAWMERHGWVALPKDADGVPIRFKDKVVVPWSDKVYEVSGFSYQENVHLGTMTIWINTHEDGEHKALCAVDSCRHYHKPTVEDVLREFLHKQTHTCEFDEKLIAETAAKVRELLGVDG